MATIPGARSWVGLSGGIGVGPPRRANPGVRHSFAKVRVRAARGPGAARPGAKRSQSPAPNEANRRRRANPGVRLPSARVRTRAGRGSPDSGSTCQRARVNHRKSRPPRSPNPRRAPPGYQTPNRPRPGAPGSTCLPLIYGITRPSGRGQPLVQGVRRFYNGGACLVRSGRRRARRGFWGIGLKFLEAKADGGPPQTRLGGWARGLLRVSATFIGRAVRRSQGIDALRVVFESARSPSLLHFVSTPERISAANVVYIEERH